MPDLERWVTAHGGAINWYRDKFTGKSMDRPGMEKLLADLRAGKVERIVVWRLDRLGRTTRGLCQLFDELGERTVDLVSLKDGLSMPSPAGRLHARILASVAEYETEVRAERVAAGQADARKKGKKWGGSKKGWRWKVTDDQLSAIHEMRAAGKGLKLWVNVHRLIGHTVPHGYREVVDQIPSVPPHDVAVGPLVNDLSVRDREVFKRAVRKNRAMNSA